MSRVIINAARIRIYMISVNYKCKLVNITACKSLILSCTEPSLISLSHDYSLLFTAATTMLRRISTVVHNPRDQGRIFCSVIGWKADETWKGPNIIHGQGHTLLSTMCYVCKHRSLFFYELFSYPKVLCFSASQALLWRCHRHFKYPKTHTRYQIEHAPKLQEEVSSAWHLLRYYLVTFPYYDTILGNQWSLFVTSRALYAKKIVPYILYKYAKTTYHWT